MTNSKPRLAMAALLAAVAAALVLAATPADATALVPAKTATTTPLAIFTLPDDSANTNASSATTTPATAIPTSTTNASTIPITAPPPPTKTIPANASAAAPTTTKSKPITAASGPQSSSSSTPARPIAGSVLLLGEYDWAVSPGSDGQPWSPCADMARRALTTTRSSAIQFIPTQGFLLGPSSSIERFCTFVMGVPGQPSPCEPLTSSADTAKRLASFKRDMEHCFLVAMRSGARTIAIRPHLDSGKGDGAWRNSLLLEPSVAYGGGGLSYEDVVLNPLADALSSAQSRYRAEAQQLQQPLPRVDFALQGEMSATVARFPEQWRALVEKVRARASASGCPPVRIGVGLNFNRLDDLSSISQTHDSSRLSWAGWALGLNDIGRGGGDVPKINGKAFGDLLRSVEFVSVSAYAPVSGPGFKQDELGNSAFMLVDQLEEVGVPGARSLFKPAGPLDLVYGEVGVGGGSGYKGTQRATSPSEVALRPFFGVYGDYDHSHDPWAIPANADFRREYHSKLEAYLAGSAAIEPSMAFLWSKSSWDLLGIYDHGYEDPQIAKGIQRYNCAVGSGLWDCVGGGAGGGGGNGEDSSSDGESSALVRVSSGP